MIISFEGGEGVGKTTHARLLCAYLEQCGLPWLSLREPGGSSFSERLRALFLQEGLDHMTELLLVLASRRENITKIIEPALAEGKVVVIDRFIDSTLVYQGVLGNLGLEKTRELMNLTGTWLEPDLTFIMDIDSGHSLARIVPGDKFESQGPEYHRKIRKSFLDLAVDKRHVIINSDRKRDEVACDIREKVDAVITA